MTTPRGPIVFNNSTGSDTAASGLGPSTAVSGTAAAHTNGSASTTITLTNSPDLSGVQAGDMLWLNTTSGRQYSVIASANNVAKTVTVDDSFNIALASAVDYGIGGKRATLDHADSRPILSDWKRDWIVETETDQTITSAITFSSVTGTLLRGASGARRVLTQTTNDRHFTIGGSGVSALSNLAFENSAAEPKTSAIALYVNGSLALHVMDCVFGHATNKLYKASAQGSGNGTIYATDCEVRNCISNGFDLFVGSFFLRGCWIHDCGGDGVIGYNRVVALGSIIESNSGDGIQNDNGDLHVINCTIDGNAGHGINMAGGLYTTVTVLNNSISGNGQYGFRSANSIPSGACPIDFNNYYSNTSGPRSNVPAGSNDTTVDPQYTNAAGGDFSIGTNLRATGFPLTSRNIGANQSATKSYVDIGAAQRQEPAGAGTSVIIRRGSPLMKM